MTATTTMRVWHIPQVPMEPFYVDVSSVDDAIRIMIILANYDIFQFENNIKPDYCNMSGLEVLEGDEWLEWQNDDGMTIDDVMRERDIEAEALAASPQGEGSGE